jgi:protein O-mannosyl-transferase
LLIRITGQGAIIFASLNRELRISLLAALVAVFAFSVYANTIENKFVYDDDVQVLRNPWIRSPEYIPKFFTGDVWSFRNTGRPTSNYYRPVQLLAYLSIYELAGMSAGAFHLASVLLHVACTLLVFSLARRFSNEDWIPLTTALLFAAHPIHTEAVAWVAANTELLGAFFYFLALYLFLRSLEPDKRYHLWKASSLTAYCLGLLSKEMVLSLPLVIFAYVYLTFEPNRKWRAGLLELWPYVACTAIYLALRIKVLGFLVKAQNVLPIGTRKLLLSDVVLVADYLRLLLLPIRMTAYHVFQPVDSAFDAAFLGATFLVLAAGTLLLYMRRRDPLLAWSGVSVLLTLLPVLNPRAVGTNVLAERYLYIPSFFFLLALVLTAKHVRDIWQNKGLPRVWMCRTGWALLAVVLISYCIQTVRRNADWRDNEHLYESAIRVSPNSPLMQNNYAEILSNRGDWEGARQHYLIAIQENFKNRVTQQAYLEESYLGLATVYAGEGRLQEADQAYRQVLVQFPASLKAHTGLAYALFLQGKYKEALEICTSAVAMDPKDESLWENLGVIQINLGQYTEAVESLRKATEIYPYYFDAWNSLALAYMKLGRVAEAQEAALNALRYDPKNLNSDR